MTPEPPAKIGCRLVLAPGKRVAGLALKEVIWSAALTVTRRELVTWLPKGSVTVSS